MSTRYKRGCDVPNGTLATRLDELAHVVTTGTFGSEFSMRVPAELDRDADIVMTEAARRLRAMDDKGPIFGR
jgi:hypothetical protein